MMRRTPRETVMLEALEAVGQMRDQPMNALAHGVSLPGCPHPSCIAERALATVKALDDAEMAARGPGSAETGAATIQERALAVACPKCKAPTGASCSYPGGGWTSHSLREKLSRAVTAAHPAGGRER